MTYRPITDTWILARSKVKFYGAYPAGFLHRARVLLGAPIDQPVLHVCGGKIRDYPYRGFGRLDQTLDLDPLCEPDFLQDAREPYPSMPKAQTIYRWAGVLIDRPYTEADAAKYVPGPDKLPTLPTLLANAAAVLPAGHRVGVLDYLWPRPPKDLISVAVVTVLVGFGNRGRLYSVFEKI